MSAISQGIVVLIHDNLLAEVEVLVGQGILDEGVLGTASSSSPVIAVSTSELLTCVTCVTSMMTGLASGSLGLAQFLHQLILHL